jgi:hypothetical protein
MKKVALGCMVALFAFVFAAPALAASSDDPGPSTGWLEICKNSDPTGPVSGNFSFTVTDGDYTSTQTVAVGTCTAPFQLPSGTATVTENAVPYAQVTAISALPESNLVPGSVDLADGSAQFTITGGDISTTTTAMFTNKEVTGYIEVCKQAAPGSGLTGSFQFTINGAMGFQDVVSVPVGACSDSIQVPAGSVTVIETGDAATYVVSITSVPAGSLLSSDLGSATATVAVAAGDVSTESIVTFVDSPSVLKICKVAGDPSLLGQDYTFTANSASVTVPAGPPPGGTCVIVPGIYRAGTTVNIAENVVPGTAVSSITVDPSDREVPGSNDPTDRTDSVVLGSGETVVTYTNVPAPPGLLKICKIAGPGVASGSLWTFTVAGLPGSVTVPAGSCALVTGPESGGGFPFNSTQTITETPVAGYSVTSIAADPANRLDSSSTATGTATVTIGSGVTEALYTDAASGTPAPTPGTGTGTGTGSGTGTGTGTGSGTGAGSGAGTGTGAGAGAGAATVAATNAPAAISHGRVLFAWLVKRNGRYYLVIKVASAAKTAHVRLSELGKKGALIRRTTLVVQTGKKEMVKVPVASAVRSIKVAVL